MGTLYVVATPIGNLNDITKRALDTLKEVDLILCEDTRTSMKLLNYFDIRNNLMSYHKFNEYQKIDEIIEFLEDNKNIALISDAGTPCISDPGYVLIKALRERGITIVPVGGISACITALSVSGISTDSFTFHGFFPKDNKGKRELLNSLENTSINTHVFYESPKRIINTIEFLKDNVKVNKISVFKELTKIHEKNYYGDINDVLNSLSSDVKVQNGEYTFIIEISKKSEVGNVSMSMEALLIDEMVNSNVSVKEAINRLSGTGNVKKNELYKASLNLKDILNFNKNE